MAAVIINKSIMITGKYHAACSGGYKDKYVGLEDKRIRHPIKILIQKKIIGIRDLQRM